jgi:glutamate dehydrogenase
MARDDKARATLIRNATGNVQPGKSSRAFAEPLFGYTNTEDLANYDAASLALLAEHTCSGARQAAPISASSTR